MEAPIKDILSSLWSCLQRWGGTAMLEEGQRGAAVATPQPSCQMESPSQSQGRHYPHNEVLWEARDAHKQVLEATHMLELNIDRLSKEADGIQCWHPCSHHWGRSVERSLSQHRLERCNLLWPWGGNTLRWKAPWRILRAFHLRTTGEAK